MASSACCTIPPVVTSDYTPKGTYLEFAGMKTYVAGDKNAKTAVLVVYDAFGFFPQTQQGADIIAASGPHLVVMPDFFLGSKMDLSNYPADTDEKKAKFAAFFRGPANLVVAQENAHKALAELNTTYSSVEKWGVIGYCWGGKLSVLLSGASTPFTTSVQIHPAMTNPEDAAKVTIPHLCLASKDEPADAIAETAEALKNHTIENVRNKSVVETYPTAFHGWMAARADLKDEENVKNFERGRVKDSSITESKSWLRDRDMLTSAVE